MLDEPLSPKTKGDVSLLNYIKNITYEDLKKERSEVLNVTLNDIKALKPLIEEVLNQNILCTIGSESKVEEEKHIFKEVKNLFN
jgi:Zn-dependent M16 (insulinase) family peptidase